MLVSQMHNHCTKQISFSVLTLQYGIDYEMFCKHQRPLHSSRKMRLGVGKDSYHFTDIRKVINEHANNEEQLSKKEAEGQIHEAFTW